jgi:hypothetical protein
VLSRLFRKPRQLVRTRRVGALNRDQKRTREVREEYEEALKIYGDFAKRDPEQFSADVTRVKKLLEQLPR